MNWQIKLPFVQRVQGQFRADKMSFNVVKMIKFVIFKIHYCIKTSKKNIAFFFISRVEIYE